MHISSQRGTKLAPFFQSRRNSTTKWRKNGSLRSFRNEELCFIIITQLNTATVQVKILGYRSESLQDCHGYHISSLMDREMKDEAQDRQMMKGVTVL